MEYVLMRTMLTGSPMIPLAPDDVRVIRVDLDDPPWPPDECARVLSPRERELAGRLRTMELHDRYLIAHGAVRFLLAELTGWPLAELRFEEGPHGKPFLIREEGAPDLRFNLSHSRHVALLAFSIGRDVGVDVECPRPGPDLLAIAGRFFAPAEAAAVRAAPPADRSRLFYTFWTRKEAFIKAVGSGLFLPLTGFDVRGRDAGGVEIRHEAEGRIRTWRVADLPAGPDHQAAVAGEGTDWRPVLGSRQRKHPS